MKLKIKTSSIPPPPVGWSGIEAYFRLFMDKMLPEYDKVIYSDVDVLFCGDLSEIFNENLENFDWAGVIAERQDEKNGIHTHFDENTKEYIYMDGFMVANLKAWRKKNLLERFIKTISEYGTKLKMFELDVLNLCSDNILDVPFNYCVLENIYDNDDITQAKEYPWLYNVYGKEKLSEAKNNPIIIHYAGKDTKIWLRSHEEIPAYYLEYIKKSPFYSKDLHPFFKIFVKSFLWLIIKICPIKSYRQILKQKRNKILSKNSVC